MIRTILLAFGLLGCASCSASAQLPSAPSTDSSAAVAVPMARSFDRPNGALLRPVALTYALSLVRGAQTTPLGIRTVTITEASLGGGIAGWLIVEQRTGTVVETADSVHLARADLAPLRWVAVIGRAQLAASFTRDSVFGAVQSYQGRASFSSTLPRDVLLSAGMAERMIELLPLREAYRAAATLMLVDGAGPRAVPAEIAVAQAEHLRVGGRDLDCWLVTLRAGVIEQRLWVSRDESRVVRTEQATPDGVLVAELTP